MVFFVVATIVSFYPAIEYDPQVAQIINSVSEDSLVSVVASLSGEKSVTIDGAEDSIPCRHSLRPSLPSSPPSPAAVQLDLSDLPAGVYWVAVQGTRGQVACKFTLLR